MASNAEQTDAAPGAEGIYVYCIIRSSEPRSFGPVGIGGRGDEVYTVHHQDLGAVVSRTPLVVYDPSRENVLAHQQVNETAMRDYTVLPVNFGTLFRSEQDVVELMRRTYDTLHDVLDKMEGKVEYGLKAFWDRAQVLARIEQENEEIRRLRTQAGASGADANYMAQMELGRLVETALNERSEAYVREIQALLRDWVVAWQTNRTMGEKMVMNAALLVDRANEESFMEAVERVGAQYEGTLDFQLTGPWPPYNFVRIQLKIEPGGEESAEAAP